MKALKISELIGSNPYPGRGIIIGKSPDGKNACIAYFIMGRSENSRNRVFALNGDTLYTKAFDESKVLDPSLIIYNGLRTFENSTIVTNGDQTDTIYEGLKNGKSFSNALFTREFEPDSPNYTPRISGLVNKRNNDFTYELSILKSGDENGNTCSRYFFNYEPSLGVGHLIHTYNGDGNPLPSFSGEPKAVLINDDIDEFTNSLWEALNFENKISLYVRYIDIFSNKYNERLINKNN